MTHHNAWAAGTLVALGVNHHTAPVEVRERLALDARCLQHRMPDMPHLLLATCNRTELYVWDVERSSASARWLAATLADAAGLAPAALAPYLFSKQGLDAITHQVRVATGLDSLVVGEEQILGQLRAALRQGRDNGTSVAPLDGVVSRVLEAGRRIRTATLLARRPSLASAAVVAAQRSGEFAETGLAGHLAVVVGAGVMGRSAAETLLAAGARVRIVNRTLEHAEQLARELGRTAQPASFEALPDLLASASLAVVATKARQPVLDVPTVQTAVARRSARPLVLLDVALPRNVEPAVRGIPGVRLIDLDDLERLCPADVAVRRAEIERAEALAIDEAHAIARWLRIRAMSPAIVELRQHGHAIRQRELRRAAAQLAGLTPEQHSAVDRLTASIINKLLHGPTVALREAAADSASAESGRQVLDVLRFDRARHVSTHPRGGYARGLRRAAAH